MSAQSALLKSSLVKKYWMSLTGLFLISFLVIHLVGNLQLFPFIGGREAFNDYGYFMTHFMPIKIVSYLLYGSILFHAIDGILLIVQNRAARPVKYAYEKPGTNSIWASRNMGLLGTIVLVFIVSHMYHFWSRVHFSSEQIAQRYGTNEAAENPFDLYALVYDTFQDGVIGTLLVVLYVFSMIALGFHLYHGFGSAFQTIGINHPRYTPVINKLGIGIAVIIPALFAMIPVYIVLAPILPI